MTLKDLHNYYLETKNNCNEIVLIRKVSNEKCTFRLYQEIFTGKNQWLNIDNGYLYSDKDLVSLYRNEESEDIFDILESMEILSDITVKNKIEAVTIRKISDEAFVQVKDGEILSKGLYFVLDINDFKHYEVVK